MFTEINGLKLYYEVGGKGEPVLLLHGWGGQIESFRPVSNYLSRDFMVYSLDLPGFGRSQPPNEPWGVADYTSILVKFLQKIGAKKVNVIAHSFGGRIAIMLTSIYPELVEKLILVDSAGLRPKRGFKYYLRFLLAKIGKSAACSLGGWGEKFRQKIYKLIGSKDYLSAGQMRDTFVKVVNEDLKPLLFKIKAPTLLIWGENDEETPLYLGKIMERCIRDSGLIILKNAGHFSYLDQFHHFCLILSNFLGDSRKDVTSY